jgi:hypothetical protein
LLLGFIASSYFLRYIGNDIDGSFTFSPSYVTVKVELDLTVVALDLLDESFHIDVDTTKIRLFVFSYVHKAEHGLATLAHSIIALATASCSGFAISSDNRNGFYILQLVRVEHEGYKTLFKPPAESDFPAAERHEVKVELKPVLC